VYASVVCESVCVEGGGGVWRIVEGEGGELQLVERVVVFSKLGGGGGGTEE